MVKETLETQPSVPAGVLASHAGSALLELACHEANVVEETTAAAERIAAFMSPTPLELSGALSNRVGCKVLLKRDDLTPIHTFKGRGAYNAIAQLDDDHFVTASAGNHAQGVALSAQLQGKTATIVMPTTTPEKKVQAVQALGAQVELVGATFDDAYAHSQAIQAETGARYVHPFDDSDVITGQATIALEILGQSSEVTHIFVPVGGGGLLAGVAQYVHATRPEVTIVGVEPEDSNAMARSVYAGERVTLDHVGIFADGVAVKQVGELPYEIVSRYKPEFITVSDDEICVALAGFVEEKRASLEPAGALGIAGIVKYAQAHGLLSGSVAVAICSGANIDNNRLLHVLKRAESASGRMALLRVELAERPGALHQLCSSVVSGHNITQFEYRKADTTKANIMIGLRVADAQDTKTIQKHLVEEGYSHRDLTNNQAILEHGTQLVGLAPDFSTETFYSVEFADRPGALLELLEHLGDRWNISMFHYGGSAGDTGRVLIGFEHADTAALEEVLKAHTSSFMDANMAVAEMFGQSLPQ